MKSHTEKSHMGIKKKKPGARPIEIYDKRWKELATNANRLSEAARSYLEEEKTNSLSEAFRAVKRFHTDYMSKMRDFDVRR